MARHDAAAGGLAQGARAATATDRRLNVARRALRNGRPRSGRTRGFTLLETLVAAVLIVAADTRVRRALEGEYDAIVVAAAGMLRLELAGSIGSYLDLELMLPAPGQGALAVQCRADDWETRNLLRHLDDPESRATTTAERAFLEALGGGCSAPVGAIAEVLPDSGGVLRLRGFVGSEDGVRSIRVSGEGRSAQGLGQELAETALARGARELLG